MTNAKPTPETARISATPPEAWAPLQRFAREVGRPIERFLHIEAASGVLLLVSAAIALIWANSPWRELYQQIWHAPVGVRLGTFTFQRTLEWVVNDGLMVIFFFVVGMEIRREVHQGELSEWRRAALPAAAALGGMIAPAALYLAVASAPETRPGWGVPMATDIAFAVGILALLGKRVPPALRVLLLALAVIDDLGAIIVIALFYSEGISGAGIGVALAGVLGIFAMQRFGVRSKLAYILPSLVVWGGIYAAGIHPTIAGVLIGLITPVRTWLGPTGFIRSVSGDLEHLSKSGADELSTHELGNALRRVDEASREAMSPSESLIATLHPWVAYGIMPTFALANAGVTISSVAALTAMDWRVIIAVVVGLVVGKPLGILLASWLTLRSGLGTLPAGIGVRQLVVLGGVAGVGFTMALFIAQLAFAASPLLAAAKLGVLGASLIAGVSSLILGRQLLSTAMSPGAAMTEHEAECSSEV